MPAIGYVTKQSSGAYKGQLRTLSIRAEVSSCLGCMRTSLSKLT